VINLDCTLYRSVLSGASKYFSRRLDGWRDDFWSRTGTDGKPLLVVGVEEELTEAAQAVIKLMYEEAVPQGTTALQLAQVSRSQCFPEHTPAHHQGSGVDICAGVQNLLA
jgi:hypothetical protein